jgi:hypothetical protein
MHELQDEEAPIDRAIALALAACIPPESDEIVMTLDRSEGNRAIGDFVHEFKTRTGHPPLLPDMKLYEATYQLDELFQRHGALFVRAVYTVRLENNRRSFTAKFEYANRS